MDLEYKELSFDVKGIDEQGIFKGYASTFGGEPDLGGDVILRGAFTDTINGRTKQIKMLWQHNMSMPAIGKWTSIEENNAGLKVEGQLALKTQLGSDIYELMKMEAVDSLSIGYQTLESEPGKGKVKRYLKKIGLYEISPVNMPMNPRALISSVKSLIEQANSERELEQALRDVGLSKEVAKYIVFHMKKSLAEKWSRSNESEILCSLRDVGNLFQKSVIVESLKKFKQISN